MFFDLVSFTENVLLSIIGGIFIRRAEKSFKNWTFFGIIIATHLLGLLLKCLYYTYEHSWMSLSDAYKCVKLVSKASIFLIFFAITVCLITFPFAFHLSASSSSILITMFSFVILMVSFHFSFLKAYYQKNFVRGG